MSGDDVDLKQFLTTTCRQLIIDIHQQDLVSVVAEEEPIKLVKLGAIGQAGNPLSEFQGLIPNTGAISAKVQQR